MHFVWRRMQKMVAPHRTTVASGAPRCHAVRLPAQSPPDRSKTWLGRIGAILPNSVRISAQYRGNTPLFVRISAHYRGNTLQFSPDFGAIYGQYAPIPPSGFPGIPQIILAATVTVANYCSEFGLNCQRAPGLSTATGAPDGEEQCAPMEGS